MIIIFFIKVIIIDRILFFSGNIIKEISFYFFSGYIIEMLSKMLYINTLCQTKFIYHIHYIFFLNQSIICNTLHSLIAYYIIIVLYISQKKSFFNLICFAEQLIRRSDRKNYIVFNIIKNKILKK